MKSLHAVCFRLIWCDNGEWQVAFVIRKMFFLDPELMLDQSFAKDRQKKDNHNMSECLLNLFNFLF